MSAEEVPWHKREDTYNRYFQVRTLYQILYEPRFLNFLDLTAVDKPKKSDASESLLAMRVAMIPCSTDTSHEKRV
jgi:hypothetical protein